MLTLTRSDRYALTNGHYHMAQALLMHSNGASYRQVQEALRCSPTSISEAVRAFRERGLAGLPIRHHGRPRKRTPAVEARVLELGCVRDEHGAPALSLQAIGQMVGLSRMSVLRVFKEHHLLAPSPALGWYRRDPEEKIWSLCRSEGADLVGFLLCASLRVAVFARHQKRADWTRVRHVGAFELLRYAPLVPPSWAASDPSRPRRFHRFLAELDRRFEGDILVVIDGAVRQRIRLLRRLMRRAFQLSVASVDTFAAWEREVGAGLRQIEDHLRRERPKLKWRPLAGPIVDRLRPLGKNRDETIWIAPAFAPRRAP